MKAVEVNTISKSYLQGKKSVPALHDLSFDVHAGELFGVIGPDGAGKTSLFRILTTLMLPDSGSAQVMGQDTVREYDAIRKQIGYMPGRFSLYQDLTVEENMQFFATIFNTTIAENYHLVKDIYSQLEPFKTRKAGQLSGGMKQKLALSCALIHKPAVLFLDEPTTGVDAVSRKEFWEMLARLKESGITILVSTPYMDEALRCDRIALLQDGRILDINSPRGIIQSFSKKLWAVKAANMYGLLCDLRENDAVQDCYPFGTEHHLIFKEENEQFVFWESQRQLHPDLQAHEIQPDIEDCFIALMKNKESHA